MVDERYEVKVERDLVVTAHDGVELMTDVYHPIGISRGPVIVERSGYGRALMSSLAEAFAVRGYHYVLQTVRGIDGSGGSFDIFEEPADGRATADWIDGQAWFDGNLGVNGASYMGFTAYSLASTRPPNLKAMCVAVFGSDRRFAWLSGGSLAWELVFGWNVLQWRLAASGAARTMEEVAAEAGVRLVGFDDAFEHLPMGDAGRLMTGEDIGLIGQVLSHCEPGDPFWDPLVFTPMLEGWDVPTCLTDNWYDYQLPRTIDDYKILERAGTAPRRLVLRAGAHAGEGTFDASTYIEVPLAWFDTHLRGMTGRVPDQPVTYTVTGEGRTNRDADSWPPPHTPTAWHLHADGRLSTDAPASRAAADQYRYDPSHPTPSFGGIGLFTGGMVDNRELEARADVLVYTSDVLDDVLELTGPVHAELFVSSSLEHTDFFVRLCDVHPGGESFNVCDGLTRIRAGDVTRDVDGGFRVRVRLWDTSYRFGTGHRLRVQVSSGAHPVYVRNLGTSDPLLTATTWKEAEQAVFHDAVRPSAVVLPHAP
ncbi:MAG: CocE/NonD family hydrolase [Acidimicrobiia bacterium]